MSKYVDHLILFIIVLVCLELNLPTAHAENIKITNKITEVNQRTVITNTLNLPDLTLSEDYFLENTESISPLASANTLLTNIPIPPIHGTGQFEWPVVGRISQKFRIGHRAIDIVVKTGTEVHAADGGVIIYAGWKDGGYGYLVVIDHQNGFITLYEHNSQVLVSVGDNVNKDQVISFSGSTGHSSGPHTHFEVRLNGVPVNPLLYLP